MARFALESDSVPSVNPTGAPDARERIDVSSEAFGGSIGKALGNLGQGMEKVSETGFAIDSLKQSMEAKTHASELHSWTSDQVTDEQSKYLSLKGKAALEALPQFKTRIDEITKEARDQAGNPATAQLVDSENRRLRDVAYSGAARHAASEQKTWETRTSADNALEAGNRAAFLATQSPLEEINNDLTLQQQLTRSDLEVTNLAEGQGYDGPAISAAVAKNRGKNVENIVKLLSSDGSPTGVKRAFDFYKAQEEKIDAGSRVSIQNVLKGPLNQIAGQRIGDEVIGRPPQASPPEIVADVPANFIGALKTSEGFTAQAKWDYKQHSNGFGTKAEYPGEVIDVATANKRFNKAVTYAAGVVDRVNPNLDPGTRAALTSLTFNAGEDWVSSGLGAAVRAGDMAKAKEIFLQYNKAGGETNDALVQRRAREASWFGRGDLSAAEVGQPRINRGVAMMRIMDDPNLQNRPQVQAAALAHLTKIYQAYDLQSTQDSAAFKLKLQNSTAEALDTGTVKQPLGREEFIMGLGAAEADKAYVEYQKNIQLGADIRSTAQMAPQDLVALREKYKPVPGSPTYLDEIKRRDSVDEAIRTNEKAKAKDPATFLIQRTGMGAESWQQFQTLTQDKNATPEMRTAYASLYAEKMLAEQARLGVAPDARRVVPAAYTDALNARLENPSLNGGALPVAQMIEAEAKLWGAHWPAVYRQISEKATPVVRVVGSGVQSAAAQALVDLAPLSLQDILKDQNTEKNAAIKKDVLDAFKPLASSMAGNDGATSLFNDFRGQAEKLAAKYVIGGMTSTEAATKAYEQLVGFKYTFQDSYRVPKDAGVDASAVAKGSVIALRDLGKVEPLEANPAGRLEAGNIDLNRRPVVKNADGTISTVRSIGVNIDGQEVLIPTVGDEGKILTNEQAIERFRQTGKHLGKFDTPDNATAFAEKLHDAQAKQYGSPLSVMPAADNMGGLSSEYLSTGKIRSLQRDGKWVTSPDEKGLMLVHADQAVRRADGQPLVLTWRQLGDYANQGKREFNDAVSVGGDDYSWVQR
jgi:GH24 family phage-related lysozyme (muramidase)